MTEAPRKSCSVPRSLEQEGGTFRQAESAEATTARLVKPIVVIGGAGFVGTNLADQLLADGDDVVVFDNLSRSGVERNLQFLKNKYGSRIHTVLADIRDTSAVDSIVTNAKAIFHFAAQVAVTSSLQDPMLDFSVNAQGTLTILDSLRRFSPETPLIFASTNKVYGSLSDLDVEEFDDRYLPADAAIRRYGVNEDRSLDFCTPYGCSKGAADQYVLDYARSFGLKTVVLRMSCIYGPRQFGTEDQGWVAHFIVRALQGEAITIYGDGKQVRDILHVNDAVAAYRAALGAIDRVSGRAFNLGGGPSNAISLHAALEEIEAIIDRDITCRHEDWRKGDQLYFVADTRRLSDAIAWQPRVNWQEGLRDLAGWIGSEFAAEDTRKLRVHA